MKAAKARNILSKNFRNSPYATFLFILNSYHIWLSYCKQNWYVIDRNSECVGYYIMSDNKCIALYMASKLGYVNEVRSLLSSIMSSTDVNWCDDVSIV